MKFVYFTHSLLSDWNHGNAHFLRGVLSELMARGHEVHAYEPEGAWSLTHLLQDRGEDALQGFYETYPQLRATFYSPGELDLDRVLEGADVVIVHEWNEHELVAKVGRHHRESGDYRLFFHDTHHRSVTDEASMAGYDLTGYDGVLAFGQVIRDRYLAKGWAERAYTWHEAADTQVFRPLRDQPKVGDLVWIGNWGDEERTEELHEFLLDPVRDLGLKATVYGVRYPAEARKALADAGIEYGGWLPNYLAPQVFAQYRMTVHVPRRPYVQALSGIPTIRVFEALACGIPLISAPWTDSEHLFRPGSDYLLAKDGDEMRKQMRRILDEPGLSQSLADSGLEQVRLKHSCERRVDELMAVLRQMRREDRREVSVL